jgi:hypothetical protein
MTINIYSLNIQKVTLIMNLIFVLLNIELNY